MFDSTSRYHSLETRTLDVLGPDGTTRTLRYCGRRFLPSASSGVTLLEHTVIEGDRLDNLAARTMGDPLLFWRIADANTGMSPETLCETPGARITIAMPSA